MRRTLSFSLISLVALTLAACGGAPAQDATAKAETPTCAQPAAPPKAGETPTCGDGCAWSGTECAATSGQRGVIIPQRPDATKPKPGPDNK